MENFIGEPICVSEQQVKAILADELIDGAKKKRTDIVLFKAPKSWSSYFTKPTYENSLWVKVTKHFLNIIRLTKNCL